VNPEKRVIKYGCIREEKFYDRIKDTVIYKTTNDAYITLKEYLERNSSKHKNRVFYVTDEKQQAQYIKMFRDHDMEAVVLNTIIDSHFIQFIEMKNTDLKFCRIDADIAENLKDMNLDKEDETAKAERDALETLFKESIGDDNLKVKVESLKSTSIPGVILLEEQSRRIQEMSRMFGGLDMSATVPKEETLVLNRNNELVKSILKLNNNDEKKEDVKMFCQHIYDLAMMSHKQLEPQAMTNFIERSNDILTRLAEG
jgi:molecular chaperone HtpG